VSRALEKLHSHLKHHGVSLAATAVAAVLADRDKFKKLLTKPTADLYKPFLWGTGQNLLREALLIADHEGYHVGELIVLRRLLGAWKK